MPQAKFLLGLASTLLVTLTGQSSFAFTISLPPPDGRSDAFIRYDEEDYEGEAFLVQPEVIERGGTDELWQLLNDFSASYPNRWEFKRADQDLEGSFDLLNYYICGPQTLDCGEESFEPISGGVGAFLDLRYYPGLLSGDPIPDPTNITRGVQWIQWVYNNHPGGTTNHGFFEITLDIDPGQTTPFYPGTNGVDLIPPIPYRFFTDRPYRIDPEESHFWDAELYLAQVTQTPGSLKRKVTIYNGIKWGWRNNSRPKPDPDPDPCGSSSGSSGGGGSGGGGCSTSLRASRELPLLKSDGLDATLNTNKVTQSVPEPNSIFALLILSTGGVILKLKNRRDKN